MKIPRPRATLLATGGFRNRLLEAFCLLLVAGACWMLAWGQTRGEDLLDLRAGAIVMSASTEYDSWPALALLDGDAETGWASHRDFTAPNVIVIELARRFDLDSIVLDNTGAQEVEFPGVSARTVQIWLSTVSPDDGFVHAVTVDATQGGREEFPLPAGSEARWIKLVVASNWGNDEFTELMELEAYGQPSGPRLEQVVVSGTYLTNFGPLYLQQAGQQIVGCYNDGAATVSGTIEGRLMRVEWREEPESGEALLALDSSGERLNGLWYQNTELRGSWSGRRDLRDPEPPCDLHVEAVVEVEE